MSSELMAAIRVGYIGCIAIQAALIIYHLVTAAVVRLRPTVGGTLTEMDVEVRGGGRNLAYVPRVTFRYLVAGVSYTSTRFWWIEKVYDNEEEARKQVRRLALGDSIVVRYNPAEPRDAVVRVQSARVVSALIAWPIQILMLEAMIRGQAWQLWFVAALWAVYDVVLVAWLWMAVRAHTIEEGGD
jgi:hypothetical protein